jgi:hypothetical protein
MNTITRWEPSRGVTSLQDQVNRLLEDTLTRGRSGQAELATRLSIYTKPRASWS